MSRVGSLLLALVGAAFVAAGGSAPGVCQVTECREAVESPVESPREQRAVARLAARGLPVFCAGGRTRQVALTFDDGPTAYTPRVVAALRRLSAPATFFLIGRNATLYRSYARAETAIGAVGTHGNTHRTLTALGPVAARAEVARGRRSVERAIGRSVQLFRPPGGHRNAALDRIATEEGLLTVMYAVDPRDWASRNPAAIADAVTSDPRLVDGAIVVLHELNTATIAALPAIARSLERRGLRPVSVPRLLAGDPPTLAEQRMDARAGSCVHLFHRSR